MKRETQQRPATAEARSQQQNDKPTCGRSRAVVESVSPCIDGGRFPAKRIAGEVTTIEANCFTDGHDAVRAVLRWRSEDDGDWTEAEMTPLGNDRWRASFTPGPPGRYVYAVAAWVDHF